MHHTGVTYSLNKPTVCYMDDLNCIKSRLEFLLLQIQKNFKNVLKALRLYDYNHDGHIQRHELRKVLENYCFKFTDQQFDK